MLVWNATVSETGIFTWGILGCVTEWRKLVNNCDAMWRSCNLLSVGHCGWWVFWCWRVGGRRWPYETEFRKEQPNDSSLWSHKIWRLLALCSAMQGQEKHFRSCDEVGGVYKVLFLTFQKKIWQLVNLTISLSMCSQHIRSLDHSSLYLMTLWTLFTNSQFLTLYPCPALTV